MPSDLPDLELQQQDPTHPQPTPTDNTDTLRTQLCDLDIIAQQLKTEKAAVENTLIKIRAKIFANDSQIRRTMEGLSGELYRNQRLERQRAFQPSTVENDNFIEGMYYQMHNKPQLMKAIHAIVKEEGTLADSNLVASAVMTELTGDTFNFGHEVAVRVVAFEKKKNEELANMAQPTFDVPNPYVDPTMAVADTTMDDAVTDVDRDSSVIALGGDRDPSVISLMSHSIKSEHGSIATPYTVANGLSDLTAAAMNNPIRSVAGSVEPASVRQSPRATVVARGMTNIQKSFPGLLESISTDSPSLPNTRLRAATGKRGRESVDTDRSPTPAGLRATKKNKTDKEPAISHTFINYMKNLEQLHRGGKAIASAIRCSRCQQIKRDVRALNCLHLYCHRCVLQLRGQAQHGNAVTGFQSTCVKLGCNQIVSGKTTVIDSDIIDFLQWYDQQSPAITNVVCQIHVLNTAVAKFPDDNRIKTKLQQVQAQLKAMQTSSLGDGLVDLMAMAKLCRKPFN